MDKSNVLPKLIAKSSSTSYEIYVRNKIFYVENGESSNVSESTQEDTSIESVSITKMKTRRRKASRNISDKELQEIERNEKQKCAKAAYDNYINCKKQNDKRNAERLRRTLARLNRPAWYRELSSKQIEAADSLHNDIRDDFDEGTTHRCRKDLFYLGVCPLPALPNITKVINLCGGSDLAFLWFLKDFFYAQKKDENGEKYSVNEQLLMSAVCHLDLVTTLRELDRLLPRMPSKHQHRPNSKKTTSEGVSGPFLPPLNFSPYDKYKDPSYVVPNETTRWFADKRYNSKRNRNMIKCISITQIKDLLCSKASEQIRTDPERATSKCEAVKNLENEIIQAVEHTAKCKCADYFSKNHLKKREREKILKLLDTKLKVLKEKFDKITFELELELWIENILCDVVDDILRDKTLCENDLFNSNKNDLFHAALAKALEVDIYGTEDQAIRGCLERFWTHQIKASQMAKEEADKEADLEMIQSAKTFTREELSKMPRNPNKTKNMLNLLKVALIEMRKNPKFVLASLPDAQHLPILVEWIKARYGKKYTLKERNAAIEESMRLLKHLLQLKTELKLPNDEDISKDLELQYTDKDIALKKINQIRGKYHRNLKLQVLEVAKNYWLSMKPYYWISGLSRSTFFAYMPSCEYDVYPSKSRRPDKFV